MRTEFINPFLQAATEVLEAEMGCTPRRGSVGLEKSFNTSNDITAVVGVTGDIAGMVMIAWSFPSRPSSGQLKFR
jgi:chemotaxis protein CheX